MKRPRQTSTEPDLVSGEVVFAIDAAFASKRIIVTPVPRIDPKDLVVVSLQDKLGTFPYASNLTFYGGVTVAGLIQIYLINPGAPFASPEITLNYMVLPRDSTP